MHGPIRQRNSGSARSIAGWKLGPGPLTSWLMWSPYFFGASLAAAHLRASTRSRERWMFLVIDDPLAVAGRDVVAARVIRNFDDFPEELVRLLRARAYGTSR